MSTAFMTITRPLPSSSNSSTASTSSTNNNIISHHIHSSPSINPSALSATAAASIPLQQLLASSYRQHYPTTTSTSSLTTGRLSPPSFSSLTPLEASIIHALRQKQLEAMASDSTISNTAPLGMTGVASISHSSRASSRTSSPLTLAHVPSKHPEPADDSLAIYSQSRPNDAPLSQEEKELLNRPISPLPLTASNNPEEPTANDVLLGRGGKTNMHSGNRIFRQAVHNRQELYRKVPKYDKIWIAQNVVSKINQAGGRFMRQEQGKWVEVPQKKAIEKASQALREKEREHRRANLQFQKAKTKVGPLKKRKNFGDSDNNTII